jgi:hypothetical protein
VGGYPGGINYFGVIFRELFRGDEKKRKARRVTFRLGLRVLTRRCQERWRVWGSGSLLMGDFLSVFP